MELLKAELRKLVSRSVSPHPAIKKPADVLNDWQLALVDQFYFNRQNIDSLHRARGRYGARITAGHARLVVFNSRVLGGDQLSEQEIQTFKDLREEIVAAGEHLDLFCKVYESYFRQGEGKGQVIEQALTQNREYFERHYQDRFAEALGFAVPTPAAEDAGEGDRDSVASSVSSLADYPNLPGPSAQGSPLRNPNQFRPVQHTPPAQTAAATAGSGQTESRSETPAEIELLQRLNDLRDAEHQAATGEMSTTLTVPTTVVTTSPAETPLVMTGPATTASVVTTAATTMADGASGTTSTAGNTTTTATRGAAGGNMSTLLDNPYVTLQPPSSGLYGSGGTWTMPDQATTGQTGFTSAFLNPMGQPAFPSSTVPQVAGQLPSISRFGDPNNFIMLSPSLYSGVNHLPVGALMGIDKVTGNSTVFVPQTASSETPASAWESSASRLRQQAMAPLDEDDPLLYLTPEREWDAWLLLNRNASRQQRRDKAAQIAQKHDRHHSAHSSQQQPSGTFTRMTVGATSGGGGGGGAGGGGGGGPEGGSDDEEDATDDQAAGGSGGNSGGHDSGRNTGGGSGGGDGGGRSNQDGSGSNRRSNDGDGAGGGPPGGSGGGNGGRDRRDPDSDNSSSDEEEERTDPFANNRRRAAEIEAARGFVTQDSSSIFSIDVKKIITTPFKGVASEWGIFESQWTRLDKELRLKGFDDLGLFPILVSTLDGLARTLVINLRESDPTAYMQAWYRLVDAYKEGIPLLDEALKEFQSLKACDGSLQSMKELMSNLIQFQDKLDKTGATPAEILLCWEIEHATALMSRSHKEAIGRRIQQLKDPDSPLGHRLTWKRMLKTLKTKIKEKEWVTTTKAPKEDKKKTGGSFQASNNSRRRTDSSQAAGAPASQGGGATRRQGNQGGGGKPRNSGGQSGPAQVDGKNVKTLCPFCVLNVQKRTQSHQHTYPRRCPLLRKKPEDWLRQKVRDANGCIVCYASGHAAKDCPCAPEIVCGRNGCKSRHGAIFHDEIANKTGGRPPGRPSNQAQQQRQQQSRQTVLPPAQAPQQQQPQQAPLQQPQQPMLPMHLAYQAQAPAGYPGGPPTISYPPSVPGTPFQGQRPMLMCPSDMMPPQLQYK